MNLLQGSTSSLIHSTYPGRTCGYGHFIISWKAGASPHPALRTPGRLYPVFGIDNSYRLAVNNNCNHP
ncbi:hypothetical protein C7T94_00315 [Pedobacter yulinensis]|uniref:Uncharacterized protein n=1 Tax=Pedobacter yulinensis TaxID=2126353 RepID=A0A2T3HQF5_9SPHI|nr:hypothetical protein C7T94_00315 [Pedobacter yulinensis]